VKAMLKPDIVREATRLTRAGQLGEATALLQRMLRGESAQDGTLRATRRIALTGQQPPIIDAKANTIEETDSPHLAPAISAQPRMLPALLQLLLSWEQRTTICTRQLVYILASPVGPPLTFPLRLSPCDKVAGPMTG
jgi:hypothetical protein